MTDSVVLSLRDKKVVGIACGGLHNAVYTETGQVYTWGCNDDWSLGRALPKDVEAQNDGDASEAYWNNPHLVSTNGVQHMCCILKVLKLKIHKE